VNWEFFKRVFSKTLYLNLLHFYFPFGAAARQWARTSSLTRFLDHTQRRTTVSRLLWTSDQLVVQTSTWQHTTLNRHTSISLVGLEPTISAGQRLRTYAFECRKFFRMNFGPDLPPDIVPTEEISSALHFIRLGTLHFKSFLTHYSLRRHTIACDSL